MIARIAPWRGIGANFCAYAADKIVNITKFPLTMQKGAAAIEYFHFAASPKAFLQNQHTLSLYRAYL
jgi:hypothetical protein